MSAKAAIMSAKDATMSAKVATVSAKVATVSAKVATVEHVNYLINALTFETDFKPKYDWSGNLKSLSPTSRPSL